MTKLPSGREVAIDLGQISHKDFLRLMSSADDDPEQARLLGLVCGLTADEINDLPQADWLRLLGMIVDTSKEVATNPKSAN